MLCLHLCVFQVFVFPRRLSAGTKLTASSLSLLSCRIAVHEFCCSEEPIKKSRTTTARLLFRWFFSCFPSSADQSLISLASCSVFFLTTAQWVSPPVYLLFWVQPACPAQTSLIHLQLILAQTAKAKWNNVFVCKLLLVCPEQQALSKMTNVTLQKPFK